MLPSYTVIRFCLATYVTRERHEFDIRKFSCVGRILCREMICIIFREVLYITEKIPASDMSVDNF
jgi:hypothetical protein